MSDASRADSSELTPAQQSYRAEWRNLCFTVERYQADELINECRDKYQFAKTYQNYGRDIDRTLHELLDQANRGDFSFFTERGVPLAVLTPRLVQRLLKDWKGAIASKKIRVAEAFEVRFGEDIDVFIATEHNAEPLQAAASLDPGDALSQLSKWTRG